MAYLSVRTKQISNQDKIVELKQNVRAAMDMMSREVRMAGYNPREKLYITSPKEFRIKILHSLNLRLI